MAFERPTLPDLIDQGAAEFESRLPGVLARVRTSVVGVLNRVVAGALSALYKYAEYLDRQSWPDVCDVENLPDHGARWGVTAREASAGGGTARFYGTDGAVVATGAVLQRADGVQYTTQADVAIVAGVGDVAVLALVAGQNSNAAIGTALNLTSPVNGVNTVAMAQTALAGGADAELPESHRSRILARIRKPPQGGADFDYQAWALEVPGVTRVWVFPQEQGLGTVVVRFVRDDDAAPIPDAGEVATVQTYIDTVRPVTAQAYVLAPVAAPINFTIQLTPNSVAVQAAVLAELQALLLRVGAPGGTVLISHIREAISIAAGETDHVLTVPAANVANATGLLPIMGVVTWL